LDPKLPKPEPRSTRFFLSADLGLDRPVNDIRSIADDILSLIQGNKGVELKLSFEIDATCEAGFEPSVEKSVTENCKTLNIRVARFEK
jgi:hypothetical protein